ncbi:MAG: hypothetical protein L0219_17785 [Phycisphaerales bacterium]|nr:hypothetical protein [Phycisphaerales bacterium]
MTDRLILVAAGLLALSGVPGLFLSRRSMTGQTIATALAVFGAIIGLAGAMAAPATSESIRVSIPWSIPGAAFSLRIDSLSVIFLLPVFLMAGLGSIFGMSYWRQTDHVTNGRKLRLFYGLLPASMVFVTIAHNGLLFLFAWEVMALSAFFLVTTEDDDPSVRRAGWIYFVATHVSTLVLYALFAVIHNSSGSFALEPIDEKSTGFGVATIVFILASLAFGLKAGIMPLHVWLPSAHAAAPTHVSAFLSGVLLKIGVYGLVRVYSLLPEPPVSWGVALLVLGAMSAVVGVAFALAQHDLKRLLAYHSVENIGIIFMGLGLAMIGRSMHRPDWVVLGLAGALLHVWNHALFKSLLFFGAGSVIHAVGTREIDRMGGLAHRMPKTAILFTIGAAAICGLPPLNGFISELLVYLGLLHSVGIGGGPAFTGAAFAAPALAAAGALALACFIKVIGTVFLGQPRRDLAVSVHESPPSMLMPMVVLAVCCIGLGVAPQLAAPLLQDAINTWLGASVEGVPMLTSLAPLGSISAASIGLIVLSIAAFSVILMLVRQRPTAAAGTWDCGFASPTPRMQYTASSIAQMLVGLLAFFLRPREHRPHLRGQFPHRGGGVGFKSHVDDLVLEGWILPALRLIERWFMRLRLLQYGRVQLYVLYVLVVLILMLLGTFPIYELLRQLLSR